MILDAQNRFSNAQNVFSTGSTVRSTDVFDLQAIRDAGAGEPVYLVVQVTTAFSGGTSANFELITGSNEAVDADVNVVVDTNAIPVASLTAGKRYFLTIPEHKLPTGQRYVAVRTTCVGAVAAGAITAAIVRNPDSAYEKLPRYAAVQPFAAV
jgi:hypothetical protein